MFVTTLRRSRRGWAALSLVGLVTAMAGLTAIPASAAPVPAAIPAIVNPIDGQDIYDLPSVDGTGDPGSTAAITDSSGAQICSAPVGMDGSFSCTGATRLPAGSQELTVITTAGDGTSTTGNTVQVNSIHLPSLSFPAPDSVISASQAFSGTALPGLEVSMLDSSQKPVCTTTADEFGAFQCLPQKPFSHGPLTLVPAMTTADGTVVRGDSASWTVIASPVITSPRDGEVVGDLPVFVGTGYPGAAIGIIGARSGETICSTTVKADGTFSCPMTRRMFVGGFEVVPAIMTDGEVSVLGAVITVDVQVTPKIVRPADGGFVPALAVIEGTAGAHSSVAIVDEDNTTVCTAVVDANGAFGCAATTNLAPGKHTLTPVQTSLAGVTDRGATVNVTVAGTVPGATATPTGTSAQTPPPTVSAPAATDPAATTTAVAVSAGVSEADTLANTGANGVATAGIASGALLLAGVGALLMLRRRTRTHG